MMPKKRSREHKDLPKGWRWKNGAYRYRVPKGQEHIFDGKGEFKLGKTLPEAYRVWAERVEYLENVRTINELLDRYFIEVAPFKAERTYSENLRQQKYIRKAFGPVSLLSIKPSHIYRYYDERNSKVSAKRELALLSHALTKAVQWGYLDKHPTKGQVVLKNSKSRDRYITDDEYNHLMSTQGSPILKLYIEFAYITGLRKGDILTIRRSDLKEDGIHITTNKTGADFIIEWSDALRDCVDRVIASRNIHITPWLFCKEDGDCYYKSGKSSGFDTMWRRLRERSGIKDITLHDLRAKTASDFEDKSAAKDLLAHKNQSMTDAYIRKPNVVRPLK